MRCEWEERIAEATRSGLWTSPLRAHLQDCPRCAQTEFITASLLQVAAAPPVELPPAGMIWRRAQAIQRERKLQRAIRRPFLIAGALGVVYCVVLLLWAVSQIPAPVHRWFALSTGQNGFVTLAGASLSAIVAIVGSFVFLTEGKG